MNASPSNNYQRIDLSAEDFEDTGIELGKGASGTVKLMKYKPKNVLMAVKARKVSSRSSKR